MSAALSIKGMSIEEKLRAMELLWDDLRNRAEADVSPDWHGDELARREQALALATAPEHVEDWNQAKRHIRDSLA